MRNTCETVQVNAAPRSITNGRIPILPFCYAKSRRKGRLHLGDLIFRDIEIAEKTNNVFDHIPVQRPRRTKLFESYSVYGFAAISAFAEETSDYMAMIGTFYGVIYHKKIDGTTICVEIMWVLLFQLSENGFFEVAVSILTHELSSLLYSYRLAVRII